LAKTVAHTEPKGLRGNAVYCRHTLVVWHAVG